MSHLKKIFFVFIFVAINTSIYANEKQSTIQGVHDFTSLFQQAAEEKKVILLEISASYCGFCHKLEEEILNPMIISGEYEHVLIRQLQIDSYHDLTMPNNKTITPSQYASQKNIFVTPTILFLNSQGEEVAERIIGINSVDYFGAYVDDALKIGADKL